MVAYAAMLDVTVRLQKTEPPPTYQAEMEQLSNPGATPIGKAFLRDCSWINVCKCAKLFKFNPNSYKLWALNCAGEDARVDINFTKLYDLTEGWLISDAEIERSTRIATDMSGLWRLSLCKRYDTKQGCRHGAKCTYGPANKEWNYGTLVKY